MDDRRVVCQSCSKSYEDQTGQLILGTASRARRCEGCQFEVKLGGMVAVFTPHLDSQHPEVGVLGMVRRWEARFPLVVSVRSLNGDSRPSLSKMGDAIENSTAREVLEKAMGANVSLRMDL